MAEGFALLDAHDEWTDVRNRVRAVSEAIGEWAGTPLPIDGEELVIEPSYRFALALSRKPETEEDNEGARARNCFWSHRYRRQVMIWEEADGRILWSWLPGIGSLDQQMHTMGCSVAWGIEQEANALQTLATLLKHHAFKMYLLTGSFVETSPRSGVTYMFRKLRPTIALKARGDRLRFLAALCMHPIGYYAESWAGAMCPTDDVIAHLMLMRADEPMLWRRSTQHPSWAPEAGL